MLSMPSLSWQGVAIGDPLYRPFKVDLREQLKQSSDTVFGTYAIVREINRILAQEGSEAAINFGRTEFMLQPSLALAYRLAVLYSNAGQYSESIEVLKVIRYISTFSRDEIVLVQKIANLLNKQGERELALNLYSKLLEEVGLDKQLLISLYEGGTIVASSCGKPILSSRWSEEARKLKSPVSGKSKNKNR